MTVKHVDAGQRWLRAAAEIGSALLSTGADPMPAIATSALDAAAADLVTVGLLTPDQREIVVEIAVGEGADDLLAQRLLVSDTAAALVLDGGQAVLLAAAQAGDPAQFGPALDPGPVLVLPLPAGARVRGLLTVARRRGRAAFSVDELELAAAFATCAGVALELADSRTAEKRLVLLEDRDRIARDLHDHVIQELFAIGLRLESVATGLGRGNSAAQKVSERVEDIDRTIRRIRTTIFALRGPLDLNTDGVRQQVIEIASDLTPALGFPARVAFDGPVDLTADPDLADDITAVVREALTNVAKHARASSASVDVSVVASEIVVIVEDDGVGLVDPQRHSGGLGNMRARAELHSGTMSVEPATGGGTLLTWRACLR
ncbi:GAF domain-containing sensor histidine kinase [uncultured Jatrophihabitans sp.]|uniref:GAF domain-containing sensor histidine kinase n=1 Tax=uncultured Jatrophihabitans sp. TaxID=1610747 RepID=UPI0035CB0D67